MSADRPLSARYNERVFPERDWSPTVAQVLTLLKLKMGEELSGVLIDNLVDSIRPKLKETVSAILASHNKCDPKMRKTLSTLSMQSVSLSVLHSPNEPFFQDEMGERNAILVAAVAVIGLQMIDEIS